MSKYDTEDEKFMWLEMETAPLVRHSKEYTQALIRYNHPRHAEAMEIRAKYQKVEKGYSEVREGEVNYYTFA